MADYTIVNLTTAVVGIATTTIFQYDEIFTTPVTEGLVLQLDAFNSSSYPGTGSTWFDTTSNDNDVTLSNTTFEETANGFYSIVFSGGETSRGEIAASDSLNLTSSSNFSIEVWVYYDGPGGTGTNSQIFTADPGSNNPLNWQFRINETTNKIDFIYQTTSLRSSAVSKSSTGTVTQDTWTHIAITYGNPTLSIYLNGVLDSTFSVPTIYSTSTNIGVAAFNQDSTYDDTLQGKIAVIRAYKDKTLSAHEVLNNARTIFFETSSGTITLGNYTIEKSSTYPASPPRRPQIGQVFPRGVYNK